MDDYFSSGPMSGSTDLLYATFGQEGSPYRIEEIMGAGRMSWVLRASDSATGAKVALKILRPAMARDRETLQRFFREADVLGKIDHPGVVRMLAHGTYNGFPFTALELIDGAPLDARILKHGPLPWGQVLDCMLDLAGALDVAHRQGIVHRDLKPSNIMIMLSGRAKITDFGLVQLEGASRITQRVRTLGTPLYTAPEVLEGAATGPRSDLYALGALGSEMLRGKPPYEARDYFDLIERHRADDRGFPIDYPGACPRSLISILHALLDRDPAVRPVDAEAVCTLLRTVPRPVEGRDL